AHFAQELCGARRMADETCHMCLEGRAQLGLDAAEGLGQRLLPSRRAQAAQRRDRGRADRRRTRHLRRTGLAHEAPLVECGPGEWIRAPTFHTPIEAWPVTEHVETAHAEAHGDAG